MKIEGNRPPENQEISLRSQKLGKPEGTPAPTDGQLQTKTSDQVQLSGRAGEIGQLMSIIQQMPDIRTEKVEAVKKSIQEGTYKVDAFGIAGKILEEFSR
jgi:flagellar biosynthesis anti-sigma factor FlgM